MFARRAYNRGYEQGVRDTIARLKPSQEKLRRATESARETFAESERFHAQLRREHSETMARIEARRRSKPGAGE